MVLLIPEYGVTDTRLCWCYGYREMMLRIRGGVTDTVLCSGDAWLPGFI